MNDNTIPTSAIDPARKDRILQLALSAARRRRTRRRAGRVIPGLLLIGMIVAGIRLSHRQKQIIPQAHQDAATLQALPSPRESAPNVAILVQYIQTDPKDMAAMRMVGSPGWQVIGDDELLRALAAAGHPSGLVRMNGKAILLASPS